MGRTTGDRPSQHLPGAAHRSGRRLGAAARFSPSAGNTPDHPPDRTWWGTSRAGREHHEHSPPWHAPAPWRSGSNRL